MGLFGITNTKGVGDYYDFDKADVKKNHEALQAALNTLGTDHSEKNLTVVMEKYDDCRSTLNHFDPQKAKDLGEVYRRCILPMVTGGIEESEVQQHISNARDGFQSILESV